MPGRGLGGLRNLESDIAGAGLVVGFAFVWAPSLPADPRCQHFPGQQEKFGQWPARALPPKTQKAKVAGFRVS